MKYIPMRAYDSDIHAVILEPGEARYHVTRFGHRTVSNTAKELNAQLVTNGGDYDAYNAVGLAASDGLIYSGHQAWEPWVNWDPSDQVTINKRYQSGVTPYNALSGKRFLVYDGQRWPTNTAPWVDRHPRTLAGVSKTGQTILVVVDGRTSRSRGIDLFEAAALMISLGADRAIDLDGGGSSAMWLHDRIVNIPIDSGVPGKERAVGNRIVVWFDGSAEPTEPEPEPGGNYMYIGTVKITASPWLNVRNLPNGTKVGRLFPGDAVEVSQIVEGWAKIEKPVVSNNQDRQWAAVEYLNLTPVPTEPTDPTDPTDPTPQTVDVTRVEGTVDGEPFVWSK